MKLDFISKKEKFQLISESILTLSYEETIIDDFKQNIKTYFACNRFLIINKFYRRLTIKLFRTNFIKINISNIIIFKIRNHKN